MSKEKLFSFNTPEFPDYGFEVVSFSGTQEIGELYSYEIDLISKNSDIDNDKMLQTEVSLQLHNKDTDDIYIHGVLQIFEAHQKIDEYIYYKAYLVPKLWWLSIAQNQQIFLGKNIKDIIDGIFLEVHFTSSDYTLSLKNEYDTREYVCQYKESRYDFLRRWMDREGIYFYFKQDKDGCQVVITDDKISHKTLKDMDTLIYKPSSGLAQEEQVVSSIVSRSNNTIQSVRVRDYDYAKPASYLDTDKTASTTTQYTQTYLFGNNLSTQKQVDKSAKINDEKNRSLAKEMLCESNIRAITPGFLFTLKDYFKDDLNQEYLMIRMESEGFQSEYILNPSKRQPAKSSYSNSFTMIPSDTQYRMQNDPLWPHIGGTISAFIDASGDGEVAQLDDRGRYKVIMPFDISGKKDAKASAYIRMAQPSAGTTDETSTVTQGFHFPLHKGTEVIISFTSGDPDQPIIMGAVSNTDSPSPVNDKNLTQNIIKTHSGNYIEMEDEKQERYIKIGLDDKNFISIKKPEEESESYFTTHWETEGGSNTFVRGNTLETRLGTKEEFTFAEVLEVFVGLKQEFKLAATLDVTTGLLFEFNFAAGLEVATALMSVITPESIKLETLETTVHENKTEITQAYEKMIDDRIEVVDNAINANRHVIDLVDAQIKSTREKVLAVEQTVKTEAQIVELIEAAVKKVETKIDDVDLKVEDNLTRIIDTQMDLLKAEVDIKDCESSIENNELGIRFNKLCINS
ncbi:MAG: type VI secretion system tip protein TssI/VgrG [Campylobacterota bacterium]|nr:type VI secretion system tip protein TssI/VgrG [Campylobacterota bacterium]